MRYKVKSDPCEEGNNERCESLLGGSTTLIGFNKTGVDVDV